MTLTELSRDGVYRRYRRYRAIYDARWARVGNQGAIEECATPAGRKDMRRRVRTTARLDFWARCAGVDL
jgi:hypothetical protein